MWFRVWLYLFIMCIVFFKQKTAYEMRISDWSSDVCSSDLAAAEVDAHHIVPVVEAHPREGAVAGDAGIIHHDVDRSDLFGHPRAAVEAGLMVADVPFIGADAGAVGEGLRLFVVAGIVGDDGDALALRSEEHTSELQSLMRISYDVFS